MAKKNDNLVGQGFHTNPERINRKGPAKKLPELHALYQQTISEEDLQAILNKAKLMGKKGHMRAMEWLFELNYGKPKQNMGFTDKEGNDISPITFVLDERYQTEGNKDNPGLST